MFPLAHVGIGTLIARPFAGSGIARGGEAGLPFRWIALGTLLPDLIDKPIYYGLSLATGKRGLDLGLVCGTRTFGHTALLLVAAAALAWAFRRKWLAAIALGAATHVLLDHVGDAVAGLIGGPGVPFEGFSWDSRRVTGLLWPFLQGGFQVFPFREASEHLLTFLQPHIVIGELLGAIILIQARMRRPVSPSPT